MKRFFEVCLSSVVSSAFLPSFLPLTAAPLFLPETERRVLELRLSLGFQFPGTRTDGGPIEATLNMRPWTHSLLLLVPLDDVYLNMVLRLNPSTILRLSSYRVGRQVEEKVLQHVF